MTEKNNSILSPEYLNFKNEITARIRSAQYEALKAVNKKMIFQTVFSVSNDKSRNLNIRPVSIRSICPSISFLNEAIFMFLDFIYKDSVI